MTKLKLLSSYCGATTLLASALVVPSFQTTADDTKIYGYLAWRMEKVWDEPSRDGSGNTTFEDAPRESDLTSFNIMMQSKVDDKVKFFANLNGGGGEEVSVRNAWGEYTVNRYVNIRLGKMYRRFGLYNEYLDAVPTYIGIEAPELFDNDHLILSRETSAMLHGSVPLGDGDLLYSVSTDNGEGGPSEDDNIPIGFDVRYEFNLGAYVVGVSGYTSGGDTTSDVELGSGSPRSGVLPWMAADDFSIFGAFGQFNIDNWQLQLAYWKASHDATRDADAVVQVINNAGIHQSQRERFLLNDSGAVNAANIDTNGDYDVTTWYVRAGYSFFLEHGEVLPYVQWDVYDNPETIYNKDFGGDAEAGLADDGKFAKSTIGVIYRPVPSVAVKFDTSTHFQEINGKDESYSEIRLDVSYIFGQ